MDAVSSRHEIEVRGVVGPMDSASPVAVSLEIPADVAGSPAAQHTAWALLNMLARLDRVVSRVSVVCTSDVPLRARLSPLAGDADRFRDALQHAAAAVNVAPVDLGDHRGDVRLVIGPGNAVSDGMRVYGEGWCGGFARDRAVAAAPPSILPFGPYIAAAMAVGEVFKLVRIDPVKYPPTTAAFYSLWSHQSDTTFIHGGPAGVDSIVLNETLAGVGAVGSICANVLWATDGVSGRVLLVDGDEKGVDITNLNRYMLFGRAHLGMPKASTARDLLNEAGAIVWDANDGPLESTGRSHRRILCAVDTNPSRLAVQNHWPESLLMASTNELRAELVRCDPRMGGPCARCYNPPETVTPDDELRRRFLEADPDEQRRLAEQVGADLRDAVAWAETGECGTTGERVRDALRVPQGRTESFSAPFVSCAAGTMLAAEVVKEQLDAPVPLSPSVARALVQFWQPDRSSGARPYLRDPRCPSCIPDCDAGVVWRERTAARPLRSNASREDAGQ
ncbi:MAG: ThiF family adenylyltransferase [Actinomycetota bacterium]|nr:ThiF family adenylyltransferase [Actinomycetota bacterium]